MLASELDFDLPPELIAQQPAQPRESARLLHLQRLQNRCTDRHIFDLPSILRPDDLLVFNDSRVLRARLRGCKTISGGAVEAVLLREEALNVWQCLLHPSARLKVGTPLRFFAVSGDCFVDAAPLERRDSTWLVRFAPGDGLTDVREALSLTGQVPLPPYIHREAPEADYQTVYARLQPGAGVALDSAAAPTAGLHFTRDLLQKLHERGIRSAFVTLGVGLGTWKPITSEALEDHAMHAEEWEVTPQTAAIINAQKQSGGRVVAVGTTTCRVLESIADEQGRVTAGTGSTSIFIRPGYRFRAIDALLTNFHLPRSTLIALVAAFAEGQSHKVEQSTLTRADGKLEDNSAAAEQAEAALTGLGRIRYAYQHAIAALYRFFSFGDAMFLE